MNTQLCNLQIRRWTSKDNSTEEVETLFTSRLLLRQNINNVIKLFNDNDIDIKIESEKDNDGCTTCTITIVDHIENKLLNKLYFRLEEDVKKNHSDLKEQTT